MMPYDSNSTHFSLVTKQGKNKTVLKSIDYIIKIHVSIFTFVISVMNEIYVWELVHSTFERSLCQSFKTDKSDTKIWITCLQNSLCLSWVLILSFLFPSNCKSQHYSLRSLTRAKKMFCILNACRPTLMYQSHAFKWILKSFLTYIFSPYASAERKIRTWFSFFSIKALYIK